MPEVTLTCTPEELLYLRRAVESDLKSLQTMGAEDDEILAEDVRLARAWKARIGKALQMQVYVH